MLTKSIEAKPKIKKFKKKENAYKQIKREIV